MKNLKYNIYGSKSSIDTDIFIPLDISSEILKNIKYIQDKRIEFRDYFLQEFLDPNINIGIIDKGIITRCFVGLPDELNNSIFYTYHLHPQKYEKFVIRPVKRDKSLKAYRTLISVLSYFSRTSYRRIVKESLKSKNPKIMADTILQLFSSTDFIKELQNTNQLKKMDKKEVYKKIVFKTLLTSLLIDDIEIYTKEEAISYIDKPGKKILYRDYPITDLDIYLSDFIKEHVRKIKKIFFI